MPDTHQHELFSKLLDGSLTPSEWAEAQSLWGDETLRLMLSGDQRLRESYQHMLYQAPQPDMISTIMSRVENVPAPNRSLIWILKYGGLLGAVIFAVGLSVVFVAFSDSATTSFTFSAPELDGSWALWGLPVLILIGVGIWRMETA